MQYCTFRTAALRLVTEFNWYGAVGIVLKSLLRRTLIDGITRNGVSPVLEFCARAFIEPPSQNNGTFRSFGHRATHTHLAQLELLRASAARPSVARAPPLLPSTPFQHCVESHPEVRTRPSCGVTFAATMIRHIVFFTARDEAGIDQIVEGLSVLTSIPYARRLEIARNRKRDQLGNDIDVVVYGEFDSETDLAAYKTHNLYREAIRCVRPLRELRFAADYELSTDVHFAGTAGLTQVARRSGPAGRE